MNDIQLNITTAVEASRSGPVPTGSATGRNAAFDISEYVAGYEYRTDECDYVPTEGERAMIEDAIRGAFEAARETKSADARAFDQQDWYWLTSDPDDSGDSAHEALKCEPYFSICEISSSTFGPTRHAFSAPTLDPDNDDDEVLHFNSRDEADAAVVKRIEALEALGIGGGNE